MKLTNLSSSRQGGIKVGCLGPIMVVFLLVGGVKGIYIAIKNRQSLKMTFTEYLEKRPPADWVSLSGTQLNLLNSAYTMRLGGSEIEEIYVAVEEAGNRQNTAARVLMVSKDKALMEKISGMREMKDPSPLTPEVLDSLYIVRDVEGMMHFDNPTFLKPLHRFENQNLSLAANGMMIHEGKKPSLMTGCIMSFLGVIGSILLLRSYLKPAAVKSPPAS